MLNKVLRATAIALVGIAMLVTSARPARAGAISINQWYGFSFGDIGSALGTPPIIGFDPDPIYYLDPDPTYSEISVPDNGPWTFTLTDTATLSWTDLQVPGDRFEFFNFGSSLGTSGPDVPGALDGLSHEPCIACALADSNFGKGSVLLAPGNYSLTGTFLGVIGGGEGAFVVSSVSAVPEPATLPLLGLGLAAVLVSRRRRVALSEASLTSV